MKLLVHVSELQPGDIVSPAALGRTSPFDASIVKSVSDTTVTLFRPYATCSPFVYGATPTVIPYIGVEEYSIERSAPSQRFTVWQSNISAVTL